MKKQKFPYFKTYGCIPWINEKRRFIIFTSPKAGNTTIRKWFIYTLGFPEEKTRSLTKDVASVRHYTTEIYSRKANYHQRVLQHMADPNFHKIIVVRNPYHRIISGYLDKLVDTDLKTGPGWITELLQSIRKFYGNTFTLEQGCSFLELLVYLKATSEKKLNEHFRSQAYGKTQFKFDTIVRLEKLPKHLQMVEEKHELATGFQHEKLFSTKYSKAHKVQAATLNKAELKRHYQLYNGYPSADCFLTSVTIKLINEIYQRDFELYGYPMLNQPTDFS